LNRDSVFLFRSVPLQQHGWRLGRAALARLGFFASAIHLTYSRW
jgi:hypothetical protein